MIDDRAEFEDYHRLRLEALASDPMFKLIEARRIVVEELQKDEPDYEAYANACLWLEEHASEAEEYVQPSLPGRFLILTLAPWALLVVGLSLMMIGSFRNEPALIFAGGFGAGLPALIRPWESF